MDRMTAIGIASGIIIGLILVVILKLVMKTDSSLRCKYDERQELVRGRGFKYGFFTMLVYFMLYGAAGVVVEKMPLDHMAGSMIGVLLGVLVNACYAIWNEGYFALNENRRRVMIIFALIAIANILIATRNMMHGLMVMDGVLNFRSTNLFCGLMFVIIAIVLFLKDRMAAKEED